MSVPTGDRSPIFCMQGERSTTTPSRVSVWFVNWHMDNSFQSNLLIILLTIRSTDFFNYPMDNAFHTILFKSRSLFYSVDYPTANAFHGSLYILIMYNLCSSTVYILLFILCSSTVVCLVVCLEFSFTV